MKKKFKSKLFGIILLVITFFALWLGFNLTDNYIFFKILADIILIFRFIFVFH